MRRLLGLMLCLYVVSAAAASDSYTEEFLKQFHANPEKMLDKLPPEIRDGKVIDRGFLNAEKLDRRLLEEKQFLREEVVKKASFPVTRVAINSDNEPTILVDDAVVITNILELDRRGLSKHTLPGMFWSDTYWPIADGLLANRYAEPSFPQNKDWVANYSSYLANPTYTINSSNLSPAEKYDLVVGDYSMGLTEYSWNNGRQYVERHGHVPSWMGICHGWSAANQKRNPIPYGSIDVTAANGNKIKFYQSDVKGLITLLWAKAKLSTRFIGFRCDYTPPRDGTGRLVDEKCFDTNPASFYLSLTNQLGLKNRTFVMDATYDSEVWNFAISSYKSTYFNPQNFQQTDNIKQAIVPVSKFTIDKFKPHRSPGTAFVVGVTVDVTHLNEVGPSHKVQVKPATKTPRYILDLELDANYNVIGGEWYTRTHPDFLWGYAPDAEAKAEGDSDININDWDITKPVPAAWTAAAQKSSFNGTPLYSVIKKILEASQTTPSGEENP